MWVRQLGVASCLASTGRVTWAGDTFSHVNRSDRSPGTRQQNLIARACEARVLLLYIFSLIFLRKKGKILGAGIYCRPSLWKAFSRQNLHCSQQTLSILIKRLFIQTTSYCCAKICWSNFWIWKRNYTLKNDLGERRAIDYAYFQICAHN